MAMTNEAWRYVFGMIIIVAFVAIVGIIILGHYEEGDHIPLMAVLAALSVVSGAYAKWFFSAKNGNGGSK